jgi:hypothetical protein
MVNVSGRPTMSSTRRILTGAAVGTIGAGAIAGGLLFLAGPASADTGTTAPASSTAPAGTTSPAGTTKHPGLTKLQKLERLRLLSGRFEHTDTVLTDKDGNPVTVQVISGSVTAVSPTSVTVQAADGTSMTFGIDGDTKVSDYDASAKPKLSAGQLSDVQQNDTVVVGGKAAGSNPSSIDASRIVVKN